MKIIKESENLMVLKDKNIAVFVIGIIFLLASIAIILKLDFFINQPPFWLGFVGIILGSFLIVVTKVTTVNIDKSVSKLIFLRKWLIGKSSIEYDLKQIKEIELFIAYHTSSKGGGYSYHLAFVLNSGEIIQLIPGNSSIIRVMGRQIIPEKNIGARIAIFLGVPFQERRPPTVSETLSAVSSAIQNVAEKESREREESNIQKH